MTQRDPQPAAPPASYDVAIARPLFVRLADYCGDHAIRIDHFVEHAVKKELDHLRAAQ